jgi:heme A synthase
MRDPLPLPRPVPRWLHVWAVCSVVATFVLLAVGQLVTSFGAGMADPVWPTEPWYVFHTATDAEKAKFREQYTFFLEHTHRIAGWTVGGLVIVLAAGIWWTEPRKVVRGVALTGLVILVSGYGEFHRGLMEQRDKLASEVHWPVREGYTALSGLGIMLAAALGGFAARERGATLRFLTMLALAAVMVQGLLGGVRVRLNELFGTDLAAFHGVFAQVVFGLLITLAVLTARPAPLESADQEARRLHRWAVVLAHLVFVQVVFGALVRHYPIPANQRLHLFTAFLATVLAVLVIRAVLANPAARAAAGTAALVFAGLLLVQLYLGVEAWLARFGQDVVPGPVKVTPVGGAIRSLHALVGSGVWGASLVLSLRLRPRSAPSGTQEPAEPNRPGEFARATVSAV